MIYDLRIGNKTYAKFTSIEEARSRAFKHNMMVSRLIKEYPLFQGGIAQVVGEY